MNSVELIALGIIVLVAWVVLSLGLYEWELYTHSKRRNRGTR